jgi:putative ABC transport system permease protein
VLRNYLTIIYREAKSNLLFTLISLLGLVIGISGCLLAMLYVGEELSFDKYNTKSSRICRLIVHQFRDGRETNIIGIGAPAATALSNNFPEIEAVVRLKKSNIVKARVNGITSFYENRVYYADPSFFNIFTVPVRRGNPMVSLKTPYSLMLSKSTSYKYFGNANPLGQMIQFDDNKSFAVNGVFDDIPRASHFHIDILISFSTLEVAGDPNTISYWSDFSIPTYVLLKRSSDMKPLQSKLHSLIDPHIGEEFKEALGMSIEEYSSKSGMRISYLLQPLMSIHLSPMSESGGFEASTDPLYIKLFITVAIALLSLSVINFVNLATARSSFRAKEVSIRKVLGSCQKEIIKQFLIESVALCIGASIISIPVVLLSLSYISQLFGMRIFIGFLATPSVLLIWTIFIILVGLSAGAYPAFYISRYSPAEILKRRPTQTVFKWKLRHLFVLMQFAISAIMIIGAIIIVRQLRYINTKDLGFKKENMLIIKNATLLSNHATTFKDNLLKYPMAISAAYSSDSPIPPSRPTMMPVALEGDVDPMKAPRIAMWSVDYDLINTLGIKLVEGRSFSPEYLSDNSSIIVNRSAAKYFGLNAPLGHRLSLITSGRQGLTPSYFTIVGVTEDFHFDSMRRHIAPLVICLADRGQNLIINYRGGFASGLIAELNKLWRAYIPDEPMIYSNLARDFNVSYGADLRLELLVGIFGCLTIFICCLGLFGLVSFSLSKRKREIAIRRVLGSSTMAIIVKLVKEYLFLVLTANTIATPIAMLLISKWLAGFAYKTNLNVDVFVLAILPALALSILIVGYQAIKVAASSSAENLRHE